MSNKTIIGSQEWVSLPELDISTIKVRVDSGAKTSALHAVNIQPFQRNNDTWVTFDVYPIQHNGKKVIHCEAVVVDKRVIKSSTGNRENRYIIKTSLNINDTSWDIEVSLTNRDSMGYRMLLGREAMMGRLIVDPESSFMLGDLSDEDVKEGAVIIDVGINRIKDSTEKGFKLVGDADYKSMIGHAGAITPVPGGVGPMTIAMLVDNTVEAAEKSINSSL